MSEENPKLCQSLTKAGRSCPWPAMFSDGCCLFHSKTPEAADRRRELRERGGRSTAARIKVAERLPSFQRPQELLRRIEELYRALTAGEATPKQVTAACKLLAEARAAYELVLIEHKLKDLIDRLEANDEENSSFLRPCPRIHREVASEEEAKAILAGHRD